MPNKHLLKQGQCISSIAFDYGFHPDTIWADPENKKLRDTYENPNVLPEGVQVHIRDLQNKEFDSGAEQRHRFRRRGVPEILHVQLLEYGEPRSNLSYRIDIDGCLFNGQTDDQGNLRHTISPDAKKAKLWIGQDHEPISLFLGNIDPVRTFRGAAARLVNLGFLAAIPKNQRKSSQRPATTDDKQRSASPSEDKSDPFVVALTKFQAHHELELTGQLDNATQQKLKESFGC